MLSKFISPKIYEERPLPLPQPLMLNVPITASEKVRHKLPRELTGILQK